MLILSTRNQLIIVLLLTILMILTRSHHFATLHSLADASWAIFFLAGIYLRTVWPLLGFFILSCWLDFAAATWSGISDFCLTPAYIFLLSAYSSLWFAGRWYTYRYQLTLHTLPPLFLSATSGLILCELFSSGEFYFFSGRFAETTWSNFGTQLVKYFPLYIETFVVYIGATTMIHALYTLFTQQYNPRSTTTG